MIGFFDELITNEIQQRDQMQFELRSTYSPVDETKKITYTHEFYFFIPQALQINENTYRKEQFYLDQTNLVRFKTPTLSFLELGDLSNPLSPIGRLHLGIEKGKKFSSKQVKFELKLFGNIARSQVRDHTKKMMQDLKEAKTNEDVEKINQKVTRFCEEISSLRDKFSHFQSEFFQKFEIKLLQKFFDYVDEFFCLTTENFLLLLLQEIRKKEFLFFLNSSDEAICSLVFSLKRYRQEKGFHSPFDSVEEKKKEYSLYRASLLNKFVLEALLLSTERKEPVKQFDQLIAVLAAGFAMFLYIGLLAWYGRNFIVDATAFIIVSVLLYIVKDRLKEGLKSIYYGLALQWFPDYTTKISTLHNKETIGTLKESFTFLSRRQIPRQILSIRDLSFHSELELARRLENMLYFKKEVTLFPGYSKEKTGLKDLHDIFRFNISNFTTKASDVFQNYLDLEPENLHLKVEKSPKVYHINVIIKKTETMGTELKKESLSKIRIVLNKEGIERIEKV